MPHAIKLSTPATVPLMPEALHFTESDDANRLLAANPLALLIGMMLDQQFPMERAFYGPYLLAERVGKDLDAAAIAAVDPDDLDSAFRGPPAVHRFPSSMAKRCRDLCAHLVEHHDGDAARVWTDATDGADLLHRVEALPGFGKAKARVFVGIIGKRLGGAPEGWEEKAADWPSIADIESFDQIAALREHKRAAKRAAKESGAKR